MKNRLRGWSEPADRSPGGENVVRVRRQVRRVKFAPSTVEFLFIRNRPLLRINTETRTVPRGFATDGLVALAGGFAGRRKHPLQLHPDIAIKLGRQIISQDLKAGQFARTGHDYVDIGSTVVYLDDNVDHVNRKRCQGGPLLNERLNIAALRGRRKNPGSVPLERKHHQQRSHDHPPQAPQHVADAQLEGDAGDKPAKQEGQGSTKNHPDHVGGHQQERPKGHIGSARFQRDSDRGKRRNERYRDRRAGHRFGRFSPHQRVGTHRSSRHRYAQIEQVRFGASKQFPGWTVKLARQQRRNERGGRLVSVIP